MGKHQPALLGGVAIGVLSALPVINLANCCCLWVIGGGMLTAYLQQQRTPEPLETADAVIGGLIAGLVGAVIYVILNSALMSMTGVMWQEQMRQALDQNPDLPPGMRDMMMRFLTGGGVFLVTAAIALPLYAVFAMLGSLLGLAIFRKKTPPAGPQGPEVLQG